MKIPQPKGTRDFYPQEMAVRNHIIDGWKQISRRNGFEEYDGPIFEMLQMYQIKSGQEIAEQLFSFQDRGGRSLAIRPEITPTLARIVNQKINALPRPIKWFSVPRLCRAERPQKGRLREFFQWNIDIIGIDDCRADAEVVFTSLDYLIEQGLTDKDIAAKISSRKLLAALLTHLGIPEKNLDSMYALLDKKAKLPEEKFQELLSENVSDPALAAKITELMEVDSVDRIASIVDLDETASAALEELQQLFHLLDQMGVGNYCVFDMGIVRGLAYYTGMVFEVHDIQGQLRAVCGGGRYDNLLKDFGGPDISATGMGMGDCVLEILLREKGLLTDQTVQTRKIDYFIAFTEKEHTELALKIAARIRRKGKAASFSYKTTSIGKQFKQADAENAANCIILGEELQQNQFSVKNMTTGQQEKVDIEDFFNTLG